MAGMILIKTDTLEEAVVRNFFVKLFVAVRFSLFIYFFFLVS